MGALFSTSCGGKKNKKANGSISEADRAVLDLKNARDKLRVYQAKLSKESETLKQQAAQLLKSGKRDRALLTLKFSRFRQEKIRDVEGQLMTVEKMVNTIEWETRQASVLSSLRSGTDALNAMHEAMSLDSIQDLLEESKAAQDKEQEISALLAQAPPLSQEEEDAIRDELEQLENDTSIVLPAAPTTEIKSTAQDASVSRPLPAAAEAAAAEASPPQRRMVAA